MKRFRVVYWFSTSIITEKYVRAETIEEVMEMFKDKRVVNIEEE